MGTMGRLYLLHPVWRLFGHFASITVSILLQAACASPLRLSMAHEEQPAALVQNVCYAIMSSFRHVRRLQLQHPSDLAFSNVLFQPLIQMFPPLKKHRLAYQLEPRRELQPVVREHCFQFHLRDISSILYFVGIPCVVNVRLDEQDVINYTRRDQCAPRVNQCNGKD